MNAFDRFAAAVSSHVSHAWFFCACVLLVVVWGPSYFLFGSVDTWQLIINTITTVVTFLLVALIQNGQQQFENSTNVKLDALLDALAHLDLPADAKATLRRAAGVEERIGT